MFTDNWFPFSMMALCLVSVYWLSHMKQKIDSTRFSTMSLFKKAHCSGR